uniref:Nuclear transport factor 2 family protein n=1 Tax=Heterorhabditis bacteriophora TaxID=37862 RepID=A0A1I7XNX7_HETBA
MDIAVALSKLPTTNHYTESFVVDVHLITNMLLGFTVQGLFEDGTLVKSGEVPTLNFFSRSFIVSPRENDSVAVVSDMLYISAITSDRVARYKMQLNKANSMGSAIAPVSNSLDQMIHTAQSMGDLGVTSGEPSIDIKRQMVEQFCRDSGMLSEWSEKCLADCAWNYEVR